MEGSLRHLHIFPRRGERELSFWVNTASEHKYEAQYLCLAPSKYQLVTGILKWEKTLALYFLIL